MEEFGHLKGEEKNRYWEINLSKLSFLIRGTGRLYRFCWRIAHLIMLLPLFLSAKYYSSKLRLNTKGEKKDAVIPHKYFTEIYPACVYSPLVKAYELKLFKNCDLEEPILEIGIGDGYFSSLLFKSKGKKLTYGADLIYATLKSATKYNHCGNHLVMDALEIPLPDNCLGTVVMNNLIHHLPNRKLVLDETLRVLKKGGRFVFTDETIGWGIFTWEQLLLRKLHLPSVAEIILKYKLKLFAQNLLVDEHYYDKKSKDLNFKIIKKVNFISKTSMYFSSLFEFLNLKQGQPTRPEMRRWLNLFGLEKAMACYMENIIEYCYWTDKKQCDEGGYAFQFIEIEKLKEDGEPIMPKPDPIVFVCPRCKKTLKKTEESFFCTGCEIVYPIVNGISVFLSYREKLKSFESYLKKTRKEKVKRYIT